MNEVKQAGDRTNVRTQIETLKKRGYLREADSIGFLRRALDSPDRKIQQESCRAIIEEVIGVEHKEMRLHALERLKRLLPHPGPQKRPSEGQVDLHTHDSFSEDGYPTPSALLLAAYEEGLSTLGVVSHNQRYTDDEADRAAALLGLELFKGTEVSVSVPLEGNRSESLHLIQLYVGETDPEVINHSLRGYVVQYQETLRSLGYDLRRALEDPFPALAFLREKSSYKETLSVLRWLEESHRSRLSLTPQELEDACRGNGIYPFTIAVALWKKFGEQFQAGFELVEGDPTSRLTMGGAGEIYERLIRKARQSDGARSRLLSPDLKGMASRAVPLRRKLVLPHPNECSREVLETTLEKLALVEVEDRKYAGLLVGVEYYSHKLKGEMKEWVGGLVERLNRTHPVYRRHPLLLLPGSDHHGKFSPLCSLGLGENYPIEREPYRQQIREALLNPPALFEE